MKKITPLLFLGLLRLSADSLQTQTLDSIQTSDSPDFSDTITSEDISSTQAGNLSSLFLQQSSVHVGGGANMGQKIYMRGLEDRLLRVSIDGAAQNGNAFHHQGNVLIDPNMIKSIKLAKGVANVSAGPGALAGSMKITTKDASDFLAPNQKFGFKVGSGFFSNFGVRENLAFFGSDHKYFDVLADYDFLDTFYYRDGAHAFSHLFHPMPSDKVLGSNSMQNNLLLKANLFLPKKQKLTLNYNLFSDKAVRPFRANIGSTDPNVSGGVDYGQVLFNHLNQNHNITFGYEKGGSDEISDPSIKAVAYTSIRNAHLTPYLIPDLARDDIEGTSPRNIFLNNSGLDLSFKHILNHNSKNALEYGLNYQNMLVADYAQKVVSPAQRGRESGNILGGFIQANYSVLKELSLGFGSRYDSYFYFDKNSQSHHTWGFSPSAMILYEPLDSLDLKLSYSHVTRGALPGDAVILQEEELSIAKDLRSEKAQNLEFSLDYNSEFFGARGAVFYQNIKDFINSYGSPSQNLLVRDNLDSRIEVYGGEVGVMAYYKGFSASFDFSRSLPTARGHLIADTYELGAVVGNTYILRLSYDFKKEGVGIMWVSRFVQEIGYRGYDIYNDEISHIRKPGYGVHHIYINYTPPRLKNLRLSFAIENIFNKFYINQASPFKIEADGSAQEPINQIRAALAEPGINAKIHVSYQY